MRKSLLLSFLLVCSVWTIGLAQDRTVTGKVTSAEDEAAMPGVSVVIKGTTRGSTTGADGTYSIAIPASGATLVYSFVGTTSKEVPVGNKSVVDVSLTSDTRQLTEVVVTGSGVATSKARLGISVESVSSKNLPAAPTASIDQALVGKIPGAQISSVSGNPGAPVNIVLRGINSVQGGTLPMILVDGVQLASTDLNSLDLSNVDRVEVVQGAASASIYGAQGANGVIQIFTKRGKQGKVAVNFSTSYAVNEFLNVGGVKKADRHPYLTDANNNIINFRDRSILDYTPEGNITGISYEFGGAARLGILNINNDARKEYNANLKYYDHFKQVFQQGSTFNNSINISGANDKSDYSLTVSNNNNVTPVLKNGYLDRTNVSLNVGTEIFKGFTLRSNTQLIYSKNTLHPGLGAPGGVGFGFGNQVGDRTLQSGGVYAFLNTSPFFDLTRPLADGTSPFYQRADFLSVNAGNPFYMQQYSDGLSNKVDVIQNFEADYKLPKFVEFNAKYGLNYRNENARWTYFNQSTNINQDFWGSYHGAYAPDANGEIINYQYTSTFQNFLATAYFRTDFQKDFGINLPIQTATQVGFDYRKRRYEEYDTYGLGLSLSPPFNIASTASQAVAFDYVEPFVTYGYLVNQKITFGDYGGISGGFRSDYSSAFGRGATPFTFPNINGYISPLTLLKNRSIENVLPYFKLRAAYGEAGIQPGAFDRYPVLSQRNLGSGLVYAIPTTSNNANLQVEVSKELEMGTDFTVTTNRGSAWFSSIGGSFTYWKRTSENVIYQVNAPPSLGIQNQLTNAIDMSSNGVQFSLNLPIYNSANFKWDFTTNFGRQFSVIDKISGGADIPLTTAGGSTALALVAGQPIGQVNGYKALTSLDFTRKNGQRYITPDQEGNYTIVDGRVVDKRTYQIQFTDEVYPLMNPNPKFNVSFINGLTYKGFLSLNFQFDWVSGSKIYNQTKEWMYRDGIHGDFTKPVTIEGKTGAFSAYWSSPYYNLWGSRSGAGNNATKDFYVEDNSFVRLRNVSLAFDLARMVKLPYLNRVQVVFTGRNILTFTNYTGFDPEVSSGSANSSFDRGVDHNTLPNIKSYQVGLNIGF